MRRFDKLGVALDRERSAIPNVHPERSRGAVSAMSEAMTGLKKAAVLAVLLGPDRAADALSRGTLTKSDIAALAAEIARLGEVEQNMQRAVLQEASRFSRPGRVSGGAQLAELMLAKALDQGEAQAILERLAHRPGAPFSALVNLGAGHLVSLLQDERPRICALLLRHLPRKSAGEVLSLLPEGARVEVVMKLIRTDEVSPEVLQVLDTTLSQKAVALAGWDAVRSADKTTAARALVEILNHTDLAVENSILSTLTQENPELGEQVRDSMFIFEDLPRLDSRGLQTVVRDTQASDLAVALKGASEEVKKAVFDNLSENAAGALREEMEALGAVRRRDVYSAQQKIVTAVRAGVEQGAISLRQSPEAEDLVL